MKPLNEKHLTILRRHMVEVIAIHAEIQEDELGRRALEEQVLTAMRRIPRHLFVPQEIAHLAYHDMPLPIGFEKTISQPYICALMTDLLGPQPRDAILEIGTGLGYQTAVLAELAGHVWSVEIVEELADGAQLRLDAMGYTNFNIKVGDGSRGWPEHAPFDRIMISAAAEQVPSPLLEQLQPGGRLVMPLGPTDDQQLTVVDKDTSGVVRRRSVIPVRFTRLERGM
jgi:protein-L-isoaspartate(D-aspartate) O-methyltransferase